MNGDGRRLIGGRDVQRGKRAQCPSGTLFLSESGRLRRSARSGINNTENSAHLCVRDDGDLVNIAVFGEDVAQVSCLGVETQSKHTQAAGGRRVILHQTRQ